MYRREGLHQWCASPPARPGGGTICSERAKHGMSEKSGVEIMGKKDAV